MNTDDKYWKYNEAEDVYELYYAEYYEPELIVTIENNFGGDREGVVVLQVMALEGGFLVEYVPKSVYENKEND